MNPLRAAFVVIGALILWAFLSLLSREPMYPVKFFLGDRLPSPPETAPKTSFRDVGYENAWIQLVDRKNDLVEVQTTDSKIAILFHPKKEVLSKYRRGWIAPVTVMCPDNSNDCDFDSLQKLYVRNTEVKLVKREFLGEMRKLKLTKKPSPVP